MARTSRGPREQIIPLVTLTSGLDVWMVQRGATFTVVIANREGAGPRPVVLGVSTIRRAAITDAVAALQGAVKELRTLAVQP